MTDGRNLPTYSPSRKQKEVLKQAWAFFFFFFFNEDKNVKAAKGPSMTQKKEPAKRKRHLRNVWNTIGKNVKEERKEKRRDHTE